MGARAYGLAMSKLHAEIASLRAALATEKEGWKTIDTAPKGIKVIAGYRNSLGKWRSIMATYYPAGTLDADQDYDDADESGFAPEGWYEESETHDILLRCQTPTNWRSLPADPVAQEAVEDPRLTLVTCTCHDEASKRLCLKKYRCTVLEAYSAHPSPSPEAETTMDEAATTIATLRAECLERAAQRDEYVEHARREQARASAAEASLAQARDALKKAEQFIVNGIDLGFIRMPDKSTPDPAHDTLPLIRATLRARVAELEARATPQAGASEPEPVALFKCTYCDAVFDHDDELCGLEKCDMKPLATPPDSDAVRALREIVDGVQEWCDAVGRGTSWDYWDHHYKHYAYNGGLDKARAVLSQFKGAEREAGSGKPSAQPLTSELIPPLDYPKTVQSLEAAAKSAFLALCDTPTHNLTQKACEAIADLGRAIAALSNQGSSSNGQ